jgi:SSS family solute:Na+ symporter/sodium/pantothenate symporter
MWAWGFFAVYAVATAWLAWRSSRGTDSAASFAIGSGHMHPLVAGITLGACLASSATFVIAPGFVFADGLAGLIGFTVPLIAGISVGLVTLAFRFQRIGGQLGALTVPHFLGARYGSPLLRRLFAGLNVLNIAYLVLITVGAAYVMREALGVSYDAAVIGIVLFVFAYTGLGGATAHAWTNTLQGIVMLAISLLVVLSGAPHWGQVVPALLETGLTAPDSPLFSTHAEVWAVPFVMGFALSTQPHLLAKALYVEDRRALWATLAVGVAAFTVFSGVLLAGAYAWFVLPPDVPQDQVMARYLVAAFGTGPVGALVSVAILAAAMSTLDGLLVAIAASVGNDLFPGRGSVWVNRAVLGALAVATIVIALSPPKLVLILGQLGVYGLVVASAGPLLAGLLGTPSVPRAVASAGVGLAVHFGLALGYGVANPGVAAGIALLCSVPLTLVPLRRRSVSAAPAALEVPR